MFKYDECGNFIYVEDGVTDVVSSTPIEQTQIKSDIYIGVDPAADHTCVVIPMLSEHTPIKPDTAQLIMETCESLAAMLTDKNEKYGDSALNPSNIFSKVSTGKALLARIDDKLARIKNNDDLLRDDIMDITGYLILLMIENDWVGYNGEEKL